MPWGQPDKAENVPEDPNKPRDLAAVEAEANQVTDESLDATRRMRALAEDTRDVGAKTLDELDKQGEQLRSIEQRHDNINEEVKSSEKTLLKMEQCCGCCGCICCRAKNHEKKQVFKEGFGAGGDGVGGIVDGQPGAESARGTPNARAGGGGGHVQHITGDAREDEMDENLGAVTDILGDLKAQSLAMSGELDNQNDMIDRINTKTESNADRVANANRRTTNILRDA